jgi:hypothetical protein
VERLSRWYRPGRRPVKELVPAGNAAMRINGKPGKIE